MPPHAQAFDSETLLAHDRYVRALARSLVLDPNAADDLAQQTWVATLEGRPGGPSLRSWLAATMRNVAAKWRLSEIRRHERERRAARAEALPSTADLQERIAAQNLILAAVLALEEPYRATIALRFLEGLPPRAVARRMGIPVATVRTRVRRPLEQLRARLDREHRDRSAWCTALAPLARPEPAMGALALLAGALIVTTKTKLALAAAAGVALSLFAWQIGREPPPATPVSAEVARAASPSGAPAAASVPSLEVAIAREEIVAPDGARTGSLLVHVVWQDTQQPAEKINVLLRRYGEANPVSAERECCTDAKGDATLAELQPGKTLVTLDRGVRQEANIVAGRRSELRLQLPALFTVEGLVVDVRDEPIAGASIVLQDDLATGARGMVIAHSLANGSFRVQGIDARVQLGARATGHAPSLFCSLRGTPGEVLRTKIVLDHAGGGIAGIVRGFTGRPLEGALVQVGVYSNAGVQLADGGWGFPAHPARMRTDRDGHFRFEGVALGKQVVSVQATGHGPGEGVAEVVEGGETWLAIDLEQGVTITGRIVGPDGQPADDLALEAKPYGVRHYRSTAYGRTDRDGGFEMRDVTPGAIEIQTGRPGFGKPLLGRKRAELFGRPGDRLRWDVRFDPSLSIRGRVVDERGAPISGAGVVGVINAIDGYHESTNADRDGRFQLGNCKDAATQIVVSVAGGAAAWHDGVRPGPEEIVITVRDRDRPSVFIIGRVLGSDGKPALGTYVSPMSLERDVGFTKLPDPDGAFRLGPFAPGFWMLGLSAPGHATIHSATRGLVANETWDLGEIRLEKAGTLRIQARRADGSKIAKATATASRSGGSLLHYAQVEDGTGAFNGLQPGSYVLNIHADGCGSVCTSCEVTSERESSLEITFSPGVAHAVRFQFPSGQVSRTLHASLQDAAGRLVADQWLWGIRDNWREWKLGLAPGTYRLETKTPNGWRGSGTFEVTENPASAPTRIELR